MCQGTMAAEPFVFSLTNTRVYTIEEMSYYLYRNIYSIYEDILDDILISWVKEQLNMDDLADKLINLKHNQNNLKDIVVTILCSNDYYTEEEINQLVVTIDHIMNLPLLQRYKIKADNYLKYGMYTNALTEYRTIFGHEDIKKLSEEEYGNLVHNQAIAMLHITSYLEAARKFKEAYNLNHNKESLHEYLLALMLSGEDALLRREIEQYELDENYKEQLEFELSQASIASVETNEYKRIQHIIKLKEEGVEREELEQIESVLNQWKETYRTIAEKN